MVELARMMSTQEVISSSSALSDPAMKAASEQRTKQTRSERAFEYILANANSASHGQSAPALASSSPDASDISWKAKLHTFLSQRAGPSNGEHVVQYRLVSEKGPAHNKTFISEVEVAGTWYKGECRRSKKASEHSAARVAWCALGLDS
eukprot:TRINITY_DN69306_c0_g1_i1.p1 TRINITY_DN69306_c0_g1~~TRINITY_DN69306_c0_g1_i1.p1  ORF type:complete len:160 (+),score=13.82 TRINITY_DN69306_c0_g1_i1:36-482(+)